MNATDEQHRHTWVPNPVRAITDPDTPGFDPDAAAYACTDCDTTTAGCMECDQPLTTALTICDRCLRRARKIITDIRHDLETVPFHFAEIMGLRAVQYDRVLVTTSDDDARLPFGMDRIVEDPLALGRSLTAAKHPDTAIDTLRAWAELWADHCGDNDQQARANWATYLTGHTLWAAQNPETSQWSTYLAEARLVRATVRRLLGLNPERHPVPCVHCGGRIIQDWTANEGLDDTLRCTGCGLTWHERVYLDYTHLHTLHDLPRTHPDQLVTIDEAKRVFKGRVRPNLLDLWHHRGTLTQRGTNERGVTVYRLGDIDQRITPMGDSAS